MNSKTAIIFLALCFGFAFNGTSQLMVSKIIDKNGSKSRLGYGTFTYFDIPVNMEGTQSFRVELADFAFFPRKNDDVETILAYLSIKLGYKYILSETRTGFYIEPQLGWARVVNSEGTGSGDKNGYGDGIALAFETGYGLEVGQRGQLINVGLKLEHDRGARNNHVTSLGLRFSYAFNMFGNY